MRVLHVRTTTLQQTTDHRPGSPGKLDAAGAKETETGGRVEKVIAIYIHRRFTKQRQRGHEHTRTGN